jgi:hypothetical protein
VAATPVTVAVYAAEAGWRGQDLVIAVAVRLAAGGVLNATQAAANADYARWRAEGWGAFGPYATRTYLLFMPAAAVAVADPNVQEVIAQPIVGGAAKEAIGGVKDAAANLPGEDMLAQAKNALTLAYKAGAWMADPGNWARVAQVVLGGALILGGLVIIARNATGTIAGEVAGGIVKPVVGQAMKGDK